MDPDLELTVDHEEDNRTYHLQLSVPDGDGAQEKVSILWGLGYPYSMSDQPVWFKMTPRPSNVHLGEWSYDRTLEYAGEYIWATFIAPFVWENGIYTTEVRLPDALPTGLEIYFMAVVEPYDDIEPRVALTNLTLDDSTDWHPDVPDDGSDGPEEPGVDDEGSSSLPFISVVEDEPAIILVLIVLIVAIVVIVVLVPGRIRSTRRN
jgi:hypothetical protein